MKVIVSDTGAAMSVAAASHAAAILRRVIADRGEVRVVAATAASQIGFQEALVREPGIVWSKVELFQLDEYVGLPPEHPARFERLLREHLVAPAGIERCHVIDSTDPDRSMRELQRAISTGPIDVAFLGIGENAHLAFNDPPADFVTRQPYLVVSLDDACRRQQVSEGWFARLDDVPRTAITMSITQMLAAREIVVVVPDARKAPAVRAAVEGDISPSVPASILRTHPKVTMFLDEAAAGGRGAELARIAASGDGMPRVLPGDSADR